jgi:hypothetical protein
METPLLKDLYREMDCARIGMIFGPLGVLLKIRTGLASRDWSWILKSGDLDVREGRR